VSVVPLPEALDVLQDNQGNLWLAAYGGGVVKFDGYPGVITDKGVFQFNGSAWQAMTAANGLSEGGVSCYSK
jgi:hypothetical protein